MTTGRGEPTAREARPAGETIPEPPAALLDAYLAALAPLGERIHGVYVYGSLALGAFDPRTSDIDLLVPTASALSAAEVAWLAAAHAALTRSNPLARRLQAAYVPLDELANDAVVAPRPHYRDGRLRSGRGDLNAVTRWLVARRGIVLRGPAASTLPLAATWEAVREAMRFNLEVYWPRRAVLPRGFVFLTDYWVDFGTSTLCRILTTLEDGEIVGKDAALARWRERLPDRWRPLIDEAARIRSDRAASMRYRGRRARMRDARAFVAYARERGRRPAGDV
ncbi:MAG: DUF4111 domain-containing protein [Thermomicrobiales bacterium]|nr:DUF4111 domain-containing protein [Thermomicrobiales bacterium]